MSTKSPPRSSVSESILDRAKRGIQTENGALWAGVVAAALMLLYPPYQNSGDATGYHFLLNPGDRHGYVGRVDTSLLFVQWLVVAAIVAVRIRTRK